MRSTVLGGGAACDERRLRDAMLGRVGNEAGGQFLGPAEGRRMPAVDLIRRDAKAFARDATYELGREQAVVAAEEDPGRNVGPRLERSGLGHSRLGLFPRPAHGLRREL